MKRRIKLPLEPGGKPEPGKVSEMILEFAHPLLYADPEGPPSIEILRSAMMLVMICWNLPVYEAGGNPLRVQVKQALDTAIKTAPEPIGAVLLQLIEDRKTKFAAVPFLVLIDVKGTTLENASIVAEARMPGVSAVQN
jgi:hypothetical protein